MRKTEAFLVVVWCLSGCAPELVDPWLGSYDMRITERARPCGEPTATPTISDTRRTWMVERAAPDVLAVYGLCTMRWRAHTSARAELEPRTCDVTTELGPTRVELIGGTLQRHEDSIFGSLVVQVTAGGRCFRAGADVAGERF